MQVWLNASEAAGLLNVRPQTLYAYVSRGLVKSEVVPGSRSKRYRRSDIERLLRRQGMTRNPRSAAKASLNWHGMPVLKSSLTLIRDGKLYYRGQDAVILAEHSSLEAVAANLWGCEIAGLLKAGVPELDAPALRTLRCADNSDQGLSTQHCLNAFQTLVGQRGGSLLALGGPVAQGAQLLRRVRNCCAGCVRPQLFWSVPSRSRGMAVPRPPLRMRGRIGCHCRTVHRCSVGNFLNRLLQRPTQPPPSVSHQSVSVLDIHFIRMETRVRGLCSRICHRIESATV